MHALKPTPAGLVDQPGFHTDTPAAEPSTSAALVDEPELAGPAYREFKRSLWAARPHCHYCGRRIARKRGTLDHKHPRSRGGRDTRSNLVLSCAQCNQAKANRTVEEWATDVRSAADRPVASRVLYVKPQRGTIARSFTTDPDELARRRRVADEAAEADARSYPWMPGDDDAKADAISVAWEYARRSAVPWGIAKWIALRTVRRGSQFPVSARDITSRAWMRDRRLRPHRSHRVEIDVADVAAHGASPSHEAAVRMDVAEWMATHLSEEKRTIIRLLAEANCIADISRATGLTRTQVADRIRAIRASWVHFTSLSPEEPARVPFHRFCSLPEPARTILELAASGLRDHEIGERVGKHRVAVQRLRTAALRMLGIAEAQSLAPALVPAPAIEGGRN